MSVTPFTKGYEDAKEFIGDRRVDAATEGIYRSLYNIVYTQAIPQVLEFDIIKKEVDPPILVNADFITGTVTATKDNATITFSSSLPAAVAAGWKLKITSGADQDDLYEVATRASDTTVTLTRTFIGTTASSLNFVLYQDLMSMPSDFSRLTTNPRFWYRRNGSVQTLDFREDGIFLTKQVTIAGTPSECRIALSLDSSQNHRLQFNSGWNEDTLIYGEYSEQFDDLTEYVEGTVAVTNGSTTVTGTDTLFSSNIAANDYFRLDDDKNKSTVWYRVSSVTSNTVFVLASAYVGATVSGKAHTVSKAPDIPEIWQNGITYGTAALGALQLDDYEGFGHWQRLSGIPEGVLLSLMRHESKTRYGTQRMATVYQLRRNFRRNTRARR